MFQETSQSQTAYQTGYQHGYAAQEPRPERFPGQETEYLKGHRKGWQEGYMMQSWR
jgi:hypothetical protein